MKRRKLRERLCLSIGWPNISENEIIERYNSDGAGAHNVGKAVSLWPKFDPNFPDFWKV